MFGSVN